MARARARRARACAPTLPPDEPAVSARLCEVSAERVGAFAEPIAAASAR
jgi:hypothetical protein